MASGYLEVQGLGAALAAVDAMCKSADVRVTALDANNTLDDKNAAVPVVVQVKITGGVSDVDVALDAGRQAAGRTLPGSCIRTHLIPSDTPELVPGLQGGKLLPRPARRKKRPDAVGAVDIHCFSNAVAAMDTMLKATGVEVLDIKKYLGGQIVTLLVGGTVSNVQAAVECAQGCAGHKNTNVITNPHPELFRFIG